MIVVDDGKRKNLCQASKGVGHERQREETPTRPRLARPNISRLPQPGVGRVCKVDRRILGVLKPDLDYYRVGPRPNHNRG